MAWLITIAVALIVLSLAVSAVLAAAYERHAEKMRKRLQARNRASYGLEILVPGKGYVPANEFLRRF